MAQEIVENIEPKNSDVPENDKLKEKKDKNRPPTKIVIRRLPPTMTEETFREQVSPLPDLDYLYFVQADLNLGPSAFSRAYINFIKQEDIFLFKDQYDGYIFVDKTGIEYSAVVEFAPFQRLPKKRAVRRKDVKAGTIEDDPMYLAFLQSIEDEIKDKENEHTFDYSYKPTENDDKKVTTTPLLEFLKQRRAERQRSRDERKEDRRKKERDREIEKRKLRDEERRKKRTDVKEKEKESPFVKQVLRSTNNEKDVPVTKAVKDKDGKSKVEKKREDEKPVYKDKYQDSKARDKPTLKSSQPVRQKVVDSRGQRNEVRRSVEDLRKKTQSRGPDPQDNQGSSRRTNNVSGDTRKPPGKYRDREPQQGSTRNKERDQQRKGRDSDSKKYVKDEPKRVVDKDKIDAVTRNKQEETKMSTKTDDVVMRSESVDNSTKPNIERRYSLEGDYQSAEVSDNLSDVKPFRKSADNIEKKQNTYVPQFHAKPQERKKSSTARLKKDVGKESRKVDERKKQTTTREAKETEKVRRSSLESGNAASKAAATMRRNHSLEEETEERSRETSVVSSTDGDDKKPAEDGAANVSRPERRIRNKDRPSIEIYRPGMGRFSKQRIDKNPKSLPE